MKVSCNLLKEFVDFNIPTEELADRLTMAGLEIVSITKLGENIENVVVGEILDVQPHTSSDKLVLCKVYDGKSNLKIVCGAKNVKKGDKVPLALPGAKLPEGISIKKSIIRGIESEGMLCSEKELGVGEDSSGILILDSSSICGEDIRKTLSQNDIILDVDLTPDRGDCLSTLGIAREVSAILNVPLCKLSSAFTESEEDINDLIKIQIKEPKLCFRYAARIIKNVKIAPSPLCLQYRLKALGIRPINNVVDISNLVLMELGHPLHAFDYDLLEGKQIIVRTAQNSEKIITLDEVARKLDEGALVIADSTRAVALAGIMGARESSVQDNTKNVLLESAYFNPTNIRKSARKLDMGTEASYRFERGVDIENLINALERTTSLIQKYCGGEVVKGIIDVYPEKLPMEDIVLRQERVNKILGINIESKRIQEILKSLGFTVKSTEDKNNNFIVSIPSHRNDIFEEIDLIEEITRIYGYDKIEVSKPYWQPLDYMVNKNLNIERWIKDFFVNKGFFEVINYSFMNSEALDKLRLSPNDTRRKYLTIDNPISSEMGLLRSTIIPGILNNISWNLRYNVANIKVFEIGCIYIPQGEGNLPIEKKMLVGAVCGKQIVSYWKEDTRESDFYYLAGVIETLFRGLGIHPYYEINEDEENTYMLTKCKDKFYHPGRSAEIVIKGKVLGNLGELSPVICTDFGFSVPVYLFELDFDVLLTYVNLTKKYKPLSKYPSISRDIALIISDDVDSRDVISIIKKIGKPFLKDIRLFDVYKGEQIKKGYKSLAYSLVYQSYDSTLTDETVNKLHKKIIDELQKKLKAQIREK